MVPKTPEDLLKELEGTLKTLTVENKRLNVETGKWRTEKDEKEKLRKNTTEIASLKEAISTGVQKLAKPKESVQAEEISMEGGVPDAPPIEGGVPDAPSAPPLDFDIPGAPPAPPTPPVSANKAAPLSLAEQLANKKLKKGDATANKPAAKKDAKADFMEQLAARVQQKTSDKGIPIEPHAKVQEPPKDPRQILEEKIAAAQKRIANYQELNRTQQKQIDKLKAETEKMPGVPAEYAELGYAVYRQDQESLITKLKSKAAELEQLNTTQKAAAVKMAQAKTDLQKQAETIFEEEPVVVPEAPSAPDAPDAPPGAPDAPDGPPPPPPGPAPEFSMPKKPVGFTVKSAKATTEKNAEEAPKPAKFSMEELVLKAKKPTSERDAILKILGDPNHEHYKSVARALGDKNKDKLLSIIEAEVQRKRDLESGGNPQANLLKGALAQRAAITAKKQTMNFKTSELRSPEVVKSVAAFYDDLIKGKETDPAAAALEKNVLEAYHATLPAEQVEKPDEAINAVASQPVVKKVATPDAPVKAELSFFEQIEKELQAAKSNVETQKREANELSDKASEHVSSLIPIVVKREKPALVEEPSIPPAPAPEIEIKPITHDKKHDVEVLAALEEAAEVLKTEKAAALPLPPTLTGLERERDRTKLATQFVGDADLFSMLQAKFFDAVIPLGKELIVNALDLDRNGFLTKEQRESLGGIGNTLVKELPFIQMDNPDSVKKGFSLFVSTLQKLREFCKENPEVVGKIGPTIQAQLDPLKVFMSAAKDKLLDPDVTDVLRKGLTERFTGIEGHIQQIATHLKPAAPIIGAIVEKINEAHIIPKALQAVEKNLANVVFPIGENILKTTLDLAKDKSAAPKQAELGKTGKEIMGLPFELLTGKKNVAEVAEQLGGSLKAVGNFLGVNPEIAINSGPPFLKALVPVFEFVKGAVSVLRQLFEKGTVPNLTPKSLNKGLGALAKHAEGVENVLENQAKTVIKGHKI